MPTLHGVEKVMKLRLIAALAVLVSGWIHVKLWFDGTRDLDVIGPLFMVNAVSAVVIAVMLLTWRHWIPLFLAAGFGATTSAAFVVSATVGLFDVEESFSGGNEWISLASQAVAVVVGVLAAWREGYLSQVKLEHRPAGRRAHLH
jgi:hypothetical protein